MKKLVGALALAIACGNTAVARNIDWHDSLSDGFSASASNHKAVFVDFSASWCQYCTQMDGTYADSDVAASLDKVIPVKLDDKKDADIYAKYKVQGYPTSAFLDSDGLVIYAFVGFRNVQDFKHEFQFGLDMYQKEQDALSKLKDDANDGPANGFMGFVYASNARYSKAQRYLDKADEAHFKDNNTNIAHVSVGLNLCQAQDYDGAAGYFEKVDDTLLPTDDLKGPFYIYYCMALYKLGKKTEAETWIQKALALTNLNPTLKGLAQQLKTAMDQGG